MFETQTAQTRNDERNRCRDQWPVHQSQPGGETAGIDAPDSHFTGSIHIGQNVYSPDEHLIGLTTKIFHDLSGHISHLAVRAARLYGRHKMVPIAFVQAVDPLHVQLSINRAQFQDLPEYQSDRSIAEEADRALWKDEVLRNSDYHQVDVQVRDGIVRLYGYVASRSSQWRVETALKDIPGILGIQNYLMLDDQLLLEVANALIQIERIEGSHVSAQVQNGAVVLNGKVDRPAVRDLAEQLAANVRRVRSVINNITVTGMDLEPEDQRFLQPVVGKNIYFLDGLSGVIRHVIINPNNQRVVAIIIQGSFPEAPYNPGSVQAGELALPDRLAVIPVSAIRYLTSNAGFLLVDSTEVSKYEDFDPARVVIPGADWTPPYPYCIDDVRFYRDGIGHKSGTG